MSNINDFEIKDGRLEGYTGTDEEVTVPEGVIEIAAGVFTHNLKLTKIVLPEGVISLSPEAFYGCFNLKSVVFPSTLKMIGSKCFHRCGKLKEVAIPDGVEMIGSDAFSGCTSLQTVNIPTSLRILNEGVFSSCQIRSIFIPEGLEQIHEDALPSGLKVHFKIAAGNKNFAVQDRNLIDVRTGAVLSEYFDLFEGT